MNVNYYGLSINFNSRIYAKITYPGIKLLSSNFFPLRSNLPLHFLNHYRQFFFAFFPGFGVDIAGDSLAVGISGGVFALPEVVV